MEIAKVEPTPSTSKVEKTSTNGEKRPAVAAQRLTQSVTAMTNLAQQACVSEEELAAYHRKKIAAFRKGINHKRAACLKFANRIRMVFEFRTYGSVEFRHSPIDIRHNSFQISTSRDSSIRLQKALKKELHLYSYKISVMQELFPMDYDKRVQYCRWFNNNLKDDEVIDWSFYSDEAWFYLTGYVNSQVCRIWSEEAPGEFLQTSLHHSCLCSNAKKTDNKPRGF
ncbi:hypothetical protein ILUMI_18276 [Ignelater luminosus]|uniref:Uncharacterized protein n=1 Tax=Ignelater luminosus TaxID=2038154 RepID=A0A8K0CMF3_IGNLU|nr:hypothetical protein ILUMI_18276 [Ignelater luminosus]